MKHDIDNRARALEVQGSPTSSQNRTRDFTHLRKFYILLHCQASNTDVSKWNSAKLCDNDGKWATFANACHVHRLKNRGAKSCLFCLGLLLDKTIPNDEK